MLSNLFNLALPHPAILLLLLLSFFSTYKKEKSDKCGKYVLATSCSAGTIIAKVVPANTCPNNVSVEVKFINVFCLLGVYHNTLDQHICWRLSKIYFFKSGLGKYRFQLMAQEVGRKLHIFVGRLSATTLLYIFG
jgi:hypothetical protein